MRTRAGKVPRARKAREREEPEEFPDALDRELMAGMPKAILVVGHRRPAHVEEAFATETVSGQRIERLLGLRRRTLLWAVDACNLLGPHNEETAERLKTAASLIDLDGRELLVLCGRSTHAAFGHFRGPTIDTGESVSVQGVKAVLLPHSSGKNRAWNDPDVTARCKAAIAPFLAGLIPPGALEDSPQAAAARLAVARTRAWRDEVVKKVLAYGVRSVAARQVGVSPRTVAAHAARDPEFARALSEAREQCLDWAEAEVVRRRVVGYPGKPIPYRDLVPVMVPKVEGGIPVLDKDGKPAMVPEIRDDGKPWMQMVTKFRDVTEYDSTLLLRFLAAHRPERWSERRRTTLDGAVTFRDLAAAAAAANEPPEDGHGEGP